VDIPEKLHIIQDSLSLLHAEILLSCGVLILIFLSIFKNIDTTVPIVLSMLISLGSIIFIVNDLNTPAVFFGGMLQTETFSGNLKILMNISAILTLLISVKKNKSGYYNGEYCALVLAIVLGGHFLVMSNNLLMVFLSLEVVSIGSYVLAGYGADKKGSEGSLKYFLFGSVASAIMLYGFTILYGLTGTLDFSTEEFARKLFENNSPVLLIAGIMALAGFLFKISVAPMHFWAPDVYESAPIPVVAFFSVAPKLAGFGVLTKFILTINIYGQSSIDWQMIISSIAILTITIGNFAALAQDNAKRMMAYSSIAQSGFLLVGVAAFIPQGLHFMLFYATVYTLMNYLVFNYLQYFEEIGIKTIPEFKGAGKQIFWPMLFLLAGLISLTGLPPTAGFTGKLFIFSGLWESYELSGKSILLWLLVFGLVNTVVSLFYYLKIPYYAFIKDGPAIQTRNFLKLENLLGLILVLLILVLFFIPGVLMGWINKVNFVF
jgi:NADH-quinone oxidoreductase subunit N